MTTRKKTRTITEETLNYRILKTIRDERAPLGVDYTPEYKEDGVWITTTPAMYSYDDAVEHLKRIKARREVKTEYIYPEL